MNKNIILHDTDRKASRRSGLALMFNILGEVNSALAFAKNVYDVVEIIISWFNPSIKEDKLLKQLQANSEYMEMLRNNINDLNGRLTNASTYAELTGDNLRRIKEVQTIQTVLLADVDKRLGGLHETLASSVAFIKQGVDMLNLQSLAIEQRLQGVLLNLISIHQQLQNTRHWVDINMLAIQLSQAWQLIIHARERFAALSEEDPDKEDFNEELKAFADKMSSKGAEGLLYHITWMLNELEGHNLFGEHASEGIVISINHDLKQLTAPLPISKISYCISSFSPVLCTLSEGLSLAVKCHLINNKTVPLLVKDAAGRMDSCSKDFFAALNREILSGDFSEPALLSSVYSASWIEPFTSGDLNNEPETVSFAASSGNVIVGLSFFSKDNKYYCQVDQAPVGKYYTIDEGNNKDGIISVTKDVTNVFLSYETTSHTSLRNTERWNQYYNYNKHFRFNDNYLITRIDFILNDAYEYDYQVYASEYDFLTGTLGTQQVLANGNNSSNVTKEMRSVGDRAVQHNSLYSGFPEVKLVDGHLSPLRGFYLYLQGDEITDPVIIITEVFIDKQVNYFIEDMAPQNDLLFQARKAYRMSLINKSEDDNI